VAISSAPVQQAINASASATPTVTLGAAVGTGNFLALLVRGNNFATSSVSGCGATWTKVTSDNTQQLGELWMGVNTSGGGTVVTLTRGGVDTVCMSLSEWSGVDQTAPSDQSNHAGGSSVTPAPGSITPTQKDVLCIAMFTATNKTGAVSAGFTNLTNSSDGSTVNVQGAYKILSAGGAQAPTWTITTSTWDACIADFFQQAPLKTNPMYQLMGR
jgi:hypothetical protein